MKKSKKKEGLSRLFEIAGQKKGLLILAGLLSAGSAVCMLVPYWAVYEILKELLSHGVNPAASDGADMMRWGWIAFGGLVGGLILLYAALMSSHVAAFRILYGLRVRLSEHIGKLPLGYLNNTSTGAIKKTMDQNIEKIEGFIAHTIPDLVNVVATVAVMLVIFFSLDVWLTVVCLAVVMISLFLQFSNFMGKRAREFMSIYYDAQEKMSASAVQYVHGMPVVKIFGQSVRSFRQFNTEIQAYKTFALKCCDTYQNGIFYPPMVIRIYLFNISISAWDGCIEMHRNDIDKVMRATLAYTILHEISHSRQNTYVPTMLYNAMEYANDRNVWDNFVPAVELILKRNYKIDIYKDRVDTFVGKVYSYPYSQVSAVERLINAFLYNSMVNGENILPEDQRRIDETKAFIGNCKNVRVELTINGISTEAYIKVNGTYDQNAIYQCLELFKSLRYRFGIMADIDHNEVKDIAILKFKFAPPRDYNPITKIDETEWE